MVSANCYSRATYTVGGFPRLAYMLHPCNSRATYIKPQPPRLHYVRRPLVTLPSPNGVNPLTMRQWEDRMKYAPGLDALSGVKYDPSNIRQWVKVNGQKAHNQGVKVRNVRPIA